MPRLFKSIPIRGLMAAVALTMLAVAAHAVEPAKQPVIASLAVAGR